MEVYEHARKWLNALPHITRVRLIHRYHVTCLIDDPIPTSTSDDDCSDTVQSPPSDRGGSRELPQRTDVGVVVRPRPPNHAHKEDRVPEVHVPPDSTTDVARVSASANMILNDSVVTHRVNFYYHYSYQVSGSGPVLRLIISWLACLHGTIHSV